MKYQFRARTVRKRLLAVRFLFVAGAFGVAVMAASFNFGRSRVSATVPGNNTRVNLTSGGSESSGDTFQNVISRDGRFEAFRNNQNGFMGGDFNNTYDIYVRNLNTNALTRATISTAGVSSNQGGTYPAISETGRYVAFESASTNLIDSRTISSSYAQMYIRDMNTNTTSLLTEVSPGTFANGDTYPTDVSSDGRFILFRSYATNLGPTVTNSPANNLFELDRSTGSITWVNAEVSGAGTYGNGIVNAQMNCDGSLIVFDYSSTPLGLPYSSHIDVMLFDRRAGDKLTDLTATANGPAVNPRISCNGNYIGFTSWASNLDPMTAGTSIGYHAFIYDRINDTYRILDQTTSGSLANVNLVYHYNDPIELSLSDTGKAIFGSSATNLDPAATSGYSQLYIRDPQAGTTELLTRDSGGTAANQGAGQATLTSDGKKAGYLSSSTNLVSGDTNSQRDVFVSDTGL